MPFLTLEDPNVLTQNGATPEEVADRLSEHWGPAIPNLDPAAFAELLPEIETASSAEQALAMASCHAALVAGKYDEAIHALLAWNVEVMKGRKAAPWARASGRGAIEVRYRAVEHLLPEEHEPASLWHNQYFVDSLEKITHQLRNAQ